MDSPLLIPNGRVLVHDGEIAQLCLPDPNRGRAFLQRLSFVCVQAGFSFGNFMLRGSPKLGEIARTFEIPVDTVGLMQTWTFPTPLYTDPGEVFTIQAKDLPVSKWVYSFIVEGYYSDV